MAREEETDIERVARLMEDGSKDPGSPLGMYMKGGGDLGNEQTMKVLMAAQENHIRGRGSQQSPGATRPAQGKESPTTSSTRPTATPTRTPAWKKAARRVFRGR